MKNITIIVFAITLVLFITGCKKIEHIASANSKEVPKEAAILPADETKKGEVIDKCKNINCNDNNPCTLDSCDTATGSCKYETKACPQDYKCNINNGNCEVLDAMDKIEDAIREKLK